MAGIKISDMELKEALAGTERIGLADAGNPRAATVAAVQAFVVDQIEAIAAGSAAALADGVYLLRGGAMLPVPLSVVAQTVVDSVWAKAAEASPADGNTLPLKGAAEKTITLAVLAEYVRTKIAATVLNVSSLSDAGALAGADYALVSQGSVAKRVNLTTLGTFIYSSLSAYVAALAAVTAPADGDVMYVVQGGVEKKVTLATLKTVLGSAVAPAVTTENKVPQWSAASKTLKDGLAVQAEIRAAGVAADTALATEKAVRDAITEPTRTAGTAGGEVVLRIGASTTEGLETVVVDKTVTLGAIAGVAVFTLPVGSVLRAVQANLQTAATAGGTSDCVGLGTDAVPDAYGKTTALTQNTKIDKAMAPTLLASETAIKAFPCKSSDGAAGDTAFTAGTLRVRIVFDRLNSLDNA